MKIELPLIIKFKKKKEGNLKRRWKSKRDLGFLGFFGFWIKGKGDRPTNGLNARERQPVESFLQFQMSTIFSSFSSSIKRQKVCCHLSCKLCTDVSSQVTFKRQVNRLILRPTSKIFFRKTRELGGGRNCYSRKFFE